MRRNVYRVAFCVAFAAITSSLFQTATAQITAQLFVSGLTNPIFVTAPPGDPRIFVVEQQGIIRIIENGVVLSTPFLDITGIAACCGERGLLGLAFHPEFVTNGFFYVHYSNERVGVVGNTVISRFSVSGDPYAADSGSELILLEEAQPFANHNGGMMAFRPGDPNHFLYIALGDGGSGGDPLNSGQDVNSRLGKILRIDVDQGLPETPAAGNPFIGVAGNDFIWAYGLRNPWRFSFDRLTGDIFIGDVGQNSVEEVDFEPAASPGGVNYGWRLLEGSSDHNCVDCDGDRMNTELPIHEYTHADGVSVTGGYRYRGSAIPALQGTYFFGDLNGRLWSFRYDGAVVSEFTERTSILPAGRTISSFGEDSAGELYVVHYFGSIYKIVDPTSAATSGGGLYEVGSRATLSVDITGTTGAVTYEWFKDGSVTPLANGGTLSGADTPALIIDPVDFSDSGSYVLEFTDQSKATFSAPPITLTVVAQLPVAGVLGLGIVVGACTAAGYLALRRRRA